MIPNSTLAGRVADPTVSPEIVVRATGLTKIFKDFWGRPKARAVDNVDFEIRRGEVFGLLGPNGSGKSTTIKMILGLLYPTKGHISVFGNSPRDVATKSRIGYLPEESYLYRFLNPSETLDFFGSLFKIESSERRNRAEQLIEMVGLNQAQIYPGVHYRNNAAYAMYADQPPCPRASRASERVISLPMHMQLDRADVQRVCDTLRDVVNP